MSTRRFGRRAFLGGAGVAIGLEHHSDAGLGEVHVHPLLAKEDPLPHRRWHHDCGDDLVWTGGRAP